MAQKQKRIEFQRYIEVRCDRLLFHFHNSINIRWRSETPSRIEIFRFICNLFRKKKKKISYINLMRRRIISMVLFFSSIFFFLFCFGFLLNAFIVQQLRRVRARACSRLCFAFANNLSRSNIPFINK